MLAALAAVCPDCPPAREARHMFFHLDILRNAGLAVLPFFVTLTIVVLIVRAISHRTSRGSRHGSD